MVTCNLFLSHSWRYGDAYERLISLLNDAPGFEYRDFSIPKDDPIHNAPNTLALEAAIRDRMAFANVIVVLAGVYATYSKWIEREVMIAKETRKPILAIEPFGSERTSQFVREYADRVVAWRTSSVVDAILELTL